MDAFGELLALLYVVLLGSLLIYWPLQVLALVVARGNNRLIGLGILAFTLLVFASLGEPGPDASNFPPPYVVALVTLSNLALIGLMVRAVILRRA